MHAEDKKTCNDNNEQILNNSHQCLLCKQIKFENYFSCFQ